MRHRLSAYVESSENLPRTTFGIVVKTCLDTLAVDYTSLYRVILQAGLIKGT